MTSELFQGIGFLKRWFDRNQLKIKSLTLAFEFSDIREFAEMEMVLRQEIMHDFSMRFQATGKDEIMGIAVELRKPECPCCKRPK